jgi:hypothetical protein
MSNLISRAAQKKAVSQRFLTILIKTLRKRFLLTYFNIKNVLSVFFCYFNKKMLRKYFLINNWIKKTFRNVLVYYFMKIKCRFSIFSFIYGKKTSKRRFSYYFMRKKSLNGFLNQIRFGSDLDLFKYNPIRFDFNELLIRFDSIWTDQIFLIQIRSRIIKSCLESDPRIWIRSDFFRNTTLSNIDLHTKNWNFIFYLKNFYCIYLLSILIYFFFSYM